MLMVAGNDMYVRASPADEDDVRLTFTGQPDVVYNGVTDWLYQEDVLSGPDAIWSSPDGTHVMFTTFNDSAVGTVTYPWFATGSVLTAAGANQSPSVFPGTKTVRYPRVNHSSAFSLNKHLRTVLPVFSPARRTRRYSSGSWTCRT